MYVLEDRKSMDDTSCSSQDAKKRASCRSQRLHASCIASSMAVSAFQPGAFLHSSNKSRTSGWLARSLPAAGRARGRPAPRQPPHISTMTAVATNSSSSGSGAPKANSDGSSVAQMKAISAEDAQSILSNIASKIHGTSSATATTGASGGGGGNDGAEELTGADLANLRAVAFDSEETKKVSLGLAFVNCRQ